MKSVHVYTLLSYKSSWWCCTINFMTDSFVWNQLSLALQILVIKSPLYVKQILIIISAVVWKNSRGIRALNSGHPHGRQGIFTKLHIKSYHLVQYGTHGLRQYLSHILKPHYWLDYLAPGSHFIYYSFWLQILYQHDRT